MKASLSITVQNRVSANDLLRTIMAQGGKLGQFDERLVRDFRQKRNHVAHYGYDTQDEDECAMLLLNVGFPFLSLLLSQLFDFFLCWQDVRPDVKDFSGLTPGELPNVGLLPEVALHLKVATTTYQLARSRHAGEFNFCFRSLARYIQLGLKQASFTDAEWDVFDIAESEGTKWNAEQAAIRRLQRLTEEPQWDFDCAVCNGCASLVTALSESPLRSLKVVPVSFTCASCGFYASPTEGALSEVVLLEQIKEQSPEILRQFGVLGVEDAL